MALMIDSDLVVLSSLPTMHIGQMSRIRFGQCRIVLERVVCPFIAVLDLLCMLPTCRDRMGC